MHLFSKRFPIPSTKRTHFYICANKVETLFICRLVNVCLHADFFLLDAIKMLIETKATPLFGDQASNAIWYAVSLDTASSLVYVHRQRGLAGTQDLQCDKKGAGAEKECILF